SSAGCSGTGTVQVTVINPPVISSGASPAQICMGNCSTLTANGGNSYTWTPGNLNGTSVSVCPTVTTIYTVTGTNASGCIASGTIGVVVNTPPVIFPSASSPSLCAGQSATL